MVLRIQQPRNTHHLSMGLGGIHNTCRHSNMQAAQYKAQHSRHRAVTRRLLQSEGQSKGNAKTC
jgi:hypothetical protein